MGGLDECFSFRYIVTRFHDKTFVTLLCGSIVKHFVTLLRGSVVKHFIFGFRLIRISHVQQSRIRWRRMVQFYGNRQTEEGEVSK